MTPLIIPLVRRAILDLMESIGGEHNDEALTMMLNELGHRVARRDVAEQLRWLGNQNLILAEELAPYLVVRILADGRDVANGRYSVEGVSLYKTGE